MFQSVNEVQLWRTLILFISDETFLDKMDSSELCSKDPLLYNQVKNVQYEENIRNAEVCISYGSD